MAEGTVFKALSGFYYVESAQGTAICKARGLFRLDRGSAPLVGDRVGYTETEEGKGYIFSVFPRKNSFVRPAVANIDKMVIVASEAIPVTAPFLIDRLTAISRKNGCQPIICINKFDLERGGRLFGIYSGAGFRTIRTSAETGEGIGELHDVILGGICAFTGNSGVGKSSILNFLDPGLSIEVGGVSKKLGRGRHTTRHVQLHKLAGGAVVADTPGFSSFDTDMLTSKTELQHLFADFEGHLGQCRFDDCAHIKEPGCAVREAVSEGGIQQTRYESYVRLHGSIVSTK